MFYKRTLILSDINNINSGRKGVVTFENSLNGIKGQLRLYNFDKKPETVAIGIASGGEVIKVPITPIDNIVDFEVNKNINLQEKLSCGLVDISEVTRPQIIIGGTSNYLNDWADRVEQAFAFSAKDLSREEMYSQNQEEIESEIATVLRQDQEYKDCSMCNGCKYKQAFFENENKICETTKIEKSPSQNIQKIEEILASATPPDTYSENDNKDNAEVAPPPKETNNNEGTNNNLDSKQPEDENNNTQKEENEEEPDFYDQIKDQIDDLFKNHSREENLESIIPNSKWVKVEYEDTEGHYVMGLIYDEESLQFISYGLPAPDSSIPPKDLEEYAQWLPTTENKEGEGYWLVYQSAKSGESVKIK